MSTIVSTTNELVSAVENASPGDEVIARGGKYNFDGEWNIRSEDVTIRVADGEHAHIQFAAGLENPTQDSGIKVDGANVTVRGFEISDSGYKGIYASQADGCTFEDLDVHHCNRWGIMANGSKNVTFRYCDSHDNMDPQNSGQHSDGFNQSGREGQMSRDGLIEGCRAWNNGDDGFDMWTSEGTTIRNCWSWNNGRGSWGNGNGFKLGSGNEGIGGGHTVENCVAWDNKVDNNSAGPGGGFWWNTEDDNQITVRNCTAWGNGVDFRFEDIGHVLENNIAVGNNVAIGDAVNDTANTWNLQISDPQLLSTDPQSSDFARLAAGSPCIGAGTNGDDLGAYPYESNEDDSSTSRLPVDGATTLGASAAEITSSGLESEHSGFNGAGYINFRSDEGASAQWPLDVASAGEYNFKIRYANGGSNDRTATLMVDDMHLDITFPQTDGWVNWSTVTGTVNLSSGANDLEITTTGEDAGNVDQITLQPVDDGDSSDGGTERPGDTPNHGYNIPEPGQTDWHEPLNENFKALDRDMPVVDAEAALDDYDAAEGTLYIALDTGAVYVGDGSQWNRLGVLN